MATAVLALGACSGDPDPEAQATIPTISSPTVEDSPASTESVPPSSTTTPKPSATPSAKANPDEYVDALGGRAFVTPSQNIVCFIRQLEVDGQDEWGCIVKKYSYTDPGDSSPCPLQYGGGFVSYFGGPLEVLCRGDAIADAENGKGKVLPHGTSITIGHVTCSSAEVGVSCTDQRTSHSLFLSESKYEIS